MESAIALDPLVEQVMVVGEGRPYLTALLVLDGEHWAAFAQQQGLDPLDAANLADPKVHAAVQRRVKAALKDFPGYAKIRQLHLSLEPWTVDEGLLTPTLKVKRRVINERYAETIASLYEGDADGAIRAAF